MDHMDSGISGASANIEQLQHIAGFIAKQASPEQGLSHENLDALNHAVTTLAMHKFENVLGGAEVHQIKHNLLTLVDRAKQTHKPDDNLRLTFENGVISLSKNVDRKIADNLNTAITSLQETALRLPEVDFVVLKSAIETLTTHEFEEKLGSKELKDLEGVLGVLESHPTVQQDPEAAKGVGFLLRILELKRPAPLEAASDPGFHGKAISEGIKLLRADRLAHPEKAPLDTATVRDFARKYVLAMLQLDRQQDNKYLLRQCTSVPAQIVNGEQCQFVTITTFSGNKEKLNIIARRVQSDGQVKWCSAYYDMKKKEVTLPGSLFNSFEACRQFIAPNCHAVLPPGQRVVSDYMVSNYNVEATGEAAIEKMEDDEIVAALCDPLDLSRLEEPVITPLGNTYSLQQILRSLREKGTDPLAGRMPLNKTELRRNFLAEALLHDRELRMKGAGKERAQDIDLWKEDPILRHFEDPLSIEGEMMAVNPITGELKSVLVVAPDGYTYDRDSLLNYLSNHNNTLPNGTRCTPADVGNAYVNRAAMNVLELRLAEFDVTVKEKAK